MTQNLNGHVITAGGITVAVEGKVYQVDARNKGLYEKVRELIKAKDYASIPDTIDRMASLTKKVEATQSTNIVVRNRRVYLTDAAGAERRLQGYEITKLLQLHEEGFDIQPISNFARRVRENPSEPVRGRLYEFMEYGQLPLVEDGDFIAYKVVRGDYKDKYSGTFDNSVGQVVSMPREQVNDDDTVTCSRGLHVCSKEYIKHFLHGRGDRLMVVRVRPEDVVSIPTDYNNTKMRTAAYTVIGEISEADDPEFFGKAVYTPKLPEEPEEASKVTSRPALRDSKGRFTSASASGAKRDAKGRFTSK